VVATTFDGPAPVTMQEVPPSGNPDVFINYEEDSTRWREFTPGSDRVFTGLPNGRRGTAHIVTESADERVRDESGLKKGPHGPLPGVAITVIHDAVGGYSMYGSILPTGGTVVDSYNEDDPELMQPGTIYNLCSMTMRWGAPEDTLALGMTAEPERSDAGDMSGDPLSFANFVPGVCACVGNNPSQPMRVAGAQTTLGGLHDHTGRFVDAHSDIVFCGWGGPSLWETDGIPAPGHAREGVSADGRRVQDRVESGGNRQFRETREHSELARHDRRGAAGLDPAVRRCSGSQHVVRVEQGGNRRPDRETRSNWDDDRGVRAFRQIQQEYTEYVRGGGDQGYTSWRRSLLASSVATNNTRLLDLLRKVGRVRWLGRPLVLPRFVGTYVGLSGFLGAESPSLYSRTSTSKTLSVVSAGIWSLGLALDTTSASMVDCTRCGADEETTCALRVLQAKRLLVSCSPRHLAA